MRTNKLMCLVLVLLLSSYYVDAATFKSITPNKIKYSNGDLIYIKVVMDDPNLRINIDFSALDSEFLDSKAFILHKAGNTTYEIYYPISFINTRKDGTFPVLINAYNTVTGLSDAVTYAISLDNKAQEIYQNITPGEILVKLKEPPGIKLEEGKVTVCENDQNNCKVYTEEEYQAMINKVRDLSDEQLTQIQNQLDSYNLEGVKTELLKTMSDNDLMNKQLIQEIRAGNKEILEGFQNVTYTQTRILDRMEKVTLAGVIIPFVFVLFILYVINVRVNTTWYNK